METEITWKSAENLRHEDYRRKRFSSTSNYAELQFRVFLLSIIEGSVYTELFGV